MKVGDLVKQVCRYSGKKIRGSTSVVIAVHDWPGNEKMDLVLLNNDCSGRPQRMAHVYQENYTVVRECA